MAAIGIITLQENVNLHNTSQFQENVGYLPNNHSVCRWIKISDKVTDNESFFNKLTTFTYPDYFTIAGGISVLAKNIISKSSHEATFFFTSIVTFGLTTLTMGVRTVQINRTTQGELIDSCLQKLYKISESKAFVMGIITVFAYSQYIRSLQSLKN